MATIFPNGKLRPDNPKFDRFKDRFVQNEETGAWKLTSDGCMKRFKIPRDEMYKTAKENKIANLDFQGYVEYEERMLQNALVTWLNRGYKLRETETIEEFIQRCNEFEDRR